MKGRRKMGSLVSLGRSNVKIFLIPGSFMTSPQCILPQHSKEVTIITIPQTRVLRHDKITSRASEEIGHIIEALGYCSIMIRADYNPRDHTAGRGSHYGLPDLLKQLIFNPDFLPWLAEGGPWGGSSALDSDTAFAFPLKLVGEAVSPICL